MVMSIIGQVFGFLGSLCLLLFGMNMLSDGIQKGAGSNLQKLLGAIAGNRFSAVLTGMAVTAIIQSSGATTVMVVSFVNAEILTLTQAIAVIFGANIGTTITAWIVSLLGFSFSISSLAIPLFGVGFILKYFKKLKIHNFSSCFMGFALLFLGLGLLKESLSFGPGLTNALTKINDFGIWGLLIGVLIGTVITALIHSSSAMTAIVLTMAANGSLSFELSAAIILGSNIGSTVDAVMSSFGATTNAKRTALVHVGFNVIGTVLALCVFHPFLKLIDMIIPGTPQENITNHIAMLHTIFNLCATAIFLPFVNQIAKLAQKIIPESEKEKDEHYKLPTILPTARHLSADLYAIQIQKEISKMAELDMDLIDEIGKALGGIDEEKMNAAIEFVDKKEAYIDEMEEAITNFLQKCCRMQTVNSKDRSYFNELIHIADSLEDLSDECCAMMHTLQKYIGNDFIPPERIKEITDYLEEVRVFYEQLCVAFLLEANIDKLAKNLPEYEDQEQKIDDIKRELRKASRKRIEAGADVKSELQYMDLVRKIEKAGDCVYALIQ